VIRLNGKNITPPYRLEHESFNRNPGNDQRFVEQLRQLVLDDMNERMKREGRLTESKSLDDPAFRAWFGNSKVVDNRGRPLVVYHGTNADFSEFDHASKGRNYPDTAGFFFTSNPRHAHSYALGKDAKQGTPNIMPVYVSLQNPMVIKTKNDAGGYWYARLSTTVPEEARRKGHDGIIVIGRGGERIVIAFEQHQIKSVFAKRYDSNSTDITEAKRVELNGLPVYLNPTAQELIGLMKRSRFGDLRGCVYERDFAVWDAAFGNHQEGRDSLRQIGLGLTVDDDVMDQTLLADIVFSPTMETETDPAWGSVTVPVGPIWIATYGLRNFGTYEHRLDNIPNERLASTVAGLRRMAPALGESVFYKPDLDDKVLEFDDTGRQITPS